MTKRLIAAVHPYRQLAVCPCPNWTRPTPDTAVEEATLVVVAILVEVTLVAATWAAVTLVEATWVARTLLAAVGMEASWVAPTLLAAVGMERPSRCLEWCP